MAEKRVRKKKPRYGIKQAEKKQQKIFHSQGSWKETGRETTRKVIARDAARGSIEFGAADHELDREIKRLERRAGGGGVGGGRWHKDPKTGRRTWKIM